MGKSRKNDTTTHMRNIQNLLKKGDEEAVVNYFLGLRRHKPASWINIFEGLEEDQIIVIDILLSTLEDKSLDKKNKAALTFFGIQLALNILWSALFFGLKNPLLALIEIFILWAFILITIIKFYKISITIS